MKKYARVIITLNCSRKCSGCCNTYGKIMSVAKPLNDITTLKDYDVVMITGGEPMLIPDRVINFVKQLRAVSQCKIFLYTAWNKNNEDLRKILSVVDGIQYSLHAEATATDIKDFQSFQSEIFHYPNKSFRLFIDNKLPNWFSVLIIPSIWKRVEIKSWLSENELMEQQPNGLPMGEELFILK